MNREKYKTYITSIYERFNRFDTRSSIQNSDFSSRYIGINLKEGEGRCATHYPEICEADLKLIYNIHIIPMYFAEHPC